MSDEDPDLLRQIGAALGEGVAERRALAALATFTLRMLVAREVLSLDDALGIVDAAAEAAVDAGGSATLLQGVRTIVADPGG
jgi:hypothetical protein